MNKKKDYTLLTLLIVFTLAVCATLAFGSYDKTPKSISHTCTDSTHEKCDGQCDCDGLGCMNSGVLYTADDKPFAVLAPIRLRDYQLDIVVDTILVFDGDRLVGKIPFPDEDSTALGNLIYIDNE